ncbi:hypothetical protein DOP62_14210 (plasmid) [Synechococcus elongatus PCC 11801]|uniref:Uncharacterized protein n=1 Tax=Synechococcus elongatus PCC 11801 TaxID=2219813 RepID=A0ACD5A356_SYNEL
MPTIPELKKQLKTEQSELDKTQAKLDKVAGIIQSLKPPEDPDDPVAAERYRADKTAANIGFAKAITARDDAQKRVAKTQQAIADLEAEIAFTEQIRPTVEAYNTALAALRKAASELESQGFGLSYNSNRALKLIEPVYEAVTRGFTTNVYRSQQQAELQKPFAKGAA